ncbi:MAG: 4Fe-4S ferredoxin [Firmicutes bacterium HGW-Firmicutes-14]|jgi:NAD-dependent dihydropyrimidine dehydrogenase PreA subunit|nr:MAG: 4Fe-4S ferredoxin [Firmicutes bacterium HGW-Firmicutes-14]
MCEFCTKHGEGKKWYEVMGNYSRELLARDNREDYIKKLIPNIQREVAFKLGALDRLKVKMPYAYRFVRKIGTRTMKRYHFGQVVPLEDARKIIELADSITRLPCVCRMAARGRKNARYCLALGIDPAGIFGDYPELKSSLETLTVEQAGELLGQFDKEGLVHSVWTFKTPFIGGICNCDHDCMAYRAQVTADLMQIMFRAEYVAWIDPEKCTGCQSCRKLCNFGAIEYSSAGDKCYIHPLKCYGCGLCRNTCSTEAITLLDRQGLPGLEGVW